jgi:hypothetical protein
LKPVSLRVRDAAEFLLTSLIEQVGNFPSLTGPGSPSCILNEEDLFNKSNLMKSNSNKPHLSAAQHFRYFAASEGTIILGVLEQPSNKILGKYFLLLLLLFHTSHRNALPILDSDPMVTILIRNQFGRQVWASQIRHLPRHKCGVYSYTVNPGRPLPMNDVGSLLSFDPQYFPDSVDRVRPCLA